MAIFQIVNGKCHWRTPFTSLDEVQGRFPADCIFVDAPDYVNEQWGFDETEIGDDRFIKPVPPEGWVYDDETGQLMPEDMLADALNNDKEAKQNENNNALATYLENHPLTWTDGKQYGVTLQDQQEIALNLMSYQMAVQTAQAAAETGAEVTPFSLEWHAVDEACVPWTVEELTALSVAIRAHIYPAYTLNQSYKTQIYACEDRAAVRAITIDYSSLDPVTETEDENTDGVTNENVSEATEVAAETTTEAES